jgi:short-subunit dehydrogenase
MKTNGQGRNVVIAGATSAIALECARLFAAERARLVLVARNAERLEVVAQDLRVRGATEVVSIVADLTDLERHAEIVSRAESLQGGLDLALIAHGSLSDQARCEADAGLVAQELATNAVSAIGLVTRLAAAMEKRRSGCIAVISSVAGDRGRRSNYVYGSAKAAVNTFLSGLRSRLHGSGVSVVTVKPGFVDTPMTAHVPKNVLFVSASRAGRAVHDVMLRPRDEVYVPWFWRWIMLVIRHIPGVIFKRLPL